MNSNLPDDFNQANWNEAYEDDKECDTYVPTYESLLKAIAEYGVTQFELGINPESVRIALNSNKALSTVLAIVGTLYESLKVK